MAGSPLTITGWPVAGSVLLQVATVNGVLLAVPWTTAYHEYAAESVEAIQKHLLGTWIEGTAAVWLRNDTCCIRKVASWRQASNDKVGKKATNTATTCSAFQAVLKNGSRNSSVAKGIRMLYPQ